MMNRINDFPIRLMLVDDHQMVSDGIVAMLSNCCDFEVVGQVSEPRLVFDAINLLQPHIILLDINMPGLNGMELGRKIISAYPSARIIYLSMHGQLSYLQKAIRLGAMGYVLKSEGKDELRNAIDHVALGEKYYSRTMQKVNRNAVKFSTQQHRISRREKEVLSLIIDELTTREIASKLFISMNTVIAHRKNLLMKLGAKNTAGLVKVAMLYNLLGEGTLTSRTIKNGDILHPER